MTNKISIIGYGRFGKLLARILKNHHDIFIFDPHVKQSDYPSLSSLDEAIDSEAIFITVPIRALENTVKELGGLLRHSIPRKDEGITIIDTCSVKVFPAKVMHEHLADKANLIATHPLFGPDSFDSNSNLKMMVHNINAEDAIYEKWKTFFAKKNIRLLEMTPDEHDQLSAKTQGVTHLLGRALHAFNAEATDIDTVGFEALLKIMEQTCHDSWDLFEDLQRFNPYTDETNRQLLNSIKEIVSVAAPSSQNE